MEVQSVVLLLIVAVSVGWGIRHTRARVPEIIHRNGLTLIGTALYAFAAIHGTAAGLFLQNPAYAITGQLFSMGLLAVAVVAGLLQDRRSFPRSLISGLVAGVAVAMLINLGAWVSLALHGERLRRLYLANSIAPVGTVPLALIGAIILLQHGTLVERRLAIVTALLVVPFTVLSGVRTLWLAVVVALVIFTILTGRWRQPRTRISYAPTISIACCIVILIAGASFWWLVPRENILDQSSGRAFKGQAWVERDATIDDAARWSWTAALGRRGFILIDHYPIPPKSAYRLSTSITGHGPGRCALAIDWLREDGQKVITDRTKLVRGTGTKARVSVVSIRPRQATSVRLRASCIRNTAGQWTIQDPRLEPVSPVTAAVIAKDLMELRWRAASIVRWLRNDTSIPDVSIGRRLRENRQLVCLFADASFVRKIFGHGLGATYDLPPHQAEEALLAVEDVNYIHDFYLFLLFKLGIVGAIAVLAALGIWIRQAIVALLSQTARSWEQDFLAFALTIWSVYLLWGVSSPEIIDFRMAPLWGFLVAAQAAVSWSNRKEHELNTRDNA